MIASVCEDGCNFLYTIFWRFFRYLDSAIKFTFTDMDTELKQRLMDLLGILEYDINDPSLSSEARHQMIDDYIAEVKSLLENTPIS